MEHVFYYYYLFIYLLLLLLLLLFYFSTFYRTFTEYPAVGRLSINQTPANEKKSHLPIILSACQFEINARIQF